MADVRRLAFVMRVFGPHIGHLVVFTTAHCAKLGWNRYSSFHNLQVLRFCELGSKTPSHAFKIGVLLEKGAGFSSSAMSPDQRPTSIPSGILVDPAAVSPE